MARRDARPRSFFEKLVRGFFFLVFLFFAGSVGLTIVYRWVDPPITPLMAGRYLEYRMKGDSSGIDYRWKPLEEISMNLQRAVLSSEDRKFYQHHGFDWTSIERNWDKVQAGAKRVKGGSTITMQCARNVFLWQGRSWVRKGLEAYFTVLMEFFWSKHRIMEVYLNVIEMGTGIYGAEAAGQNYFKATAAALSPGQAAMIAAILPNPRRFSATHPSAYTSRRQRTILSAISRRGPLPDTREEPPEDESTVPPTPADRPSPVPEDPGPQPEIAPDSTPVPEQDTDK